MPTTLYSRHVGDSVEAMIVAEVIAADALKDKLKVMASDSGRITKREHLIVTGSVLDQFVRRLLPRPPRRTQRIGGRRRLREAFQLPHSRHL